MWTGFILESMYLHEWTNWHNVFNMHMFSMKHSASNVNSIIYSFSQNKSTHLVKQRKKRNLEFPINWINEREANEYHLWRCFSIHSQWIMQCVPLAFNSQINRTFFSPCVAFWCRKRVIWTIHRYNTSFFAVSFERWHVLYTLCHQVESMLPG